MKTLALFRHAKSDWSDRRLDDFDRPLAPRGQKAAPRMGDAMRALGLVPDLVLCSEARRARETWKLAAPALDATPSVKVRRNLYLAAPAVLLNAIQEAEPEVGTQMLIGHNPDFEDLAAALAGPGSDPALLQSLREKFPTATVAILTFDVQSWDDVKPGAGTLRHFLRPRDLD